jgi:cell division protein FtsB
MRASGSDPLSSLPFLSKRILPLLVIATAAISVPAMALSRGGLARLDALREERRRADQDAARLSREIERLRAEVRRIKEDPSYVERAARDELGLVRQTEVVFQFRR